MLREPVFSSIEIETHGFKLSAALQKLTRWIKQPSEITGNISISEDSKRLDIYTELKNIQAAVGANADQASWYFQERNLGDASFNVACRIFRLLLTDQSPFYVNVSDTEFCTFARALQNYRIYLSRLNELVKKEAIAEKEKKEEVNNYLLETEQLVSALIFNGSQFPFVYKLAAYISREKGDLVGLQKLLAKYIDLLKFYDSRDKVEEEFFKNLKDNKNFRNKIRPVMAGTGISLINGPTVTICCIISDDQGEQYLISTEQGLSGNVGDPVIQPSHPDGGGPLDGIAEITKKITTIPYDPNDVFSSVNYAPGVMARILPGVQASPDIPGVGRIQGILGKEQIIDLFEKSPGPVPVKIVGSTSGLVNGTMTTIVATVLIKEGEKSFFFEDSIEITGFSALVPGNAGAPVLTQDNMLIGMIFAGISGTTSRLGTAFAVPFWALKEALGVKIVLS